MTRERLSEEEIGRISRSTPIPETLAVVEDILTIRVTAARLAAEAICAVQVDAAHLNGNPRFSGTRIPLLNIFLEDLLDPGAFPGIQPVHRKVIETLMEAHVSALDEVKREARLNACRTILGLSWIPLSFRHDIIRNVGVSLAELSNPPLSAPAVPDGAAKGDGD